MTGLWAHGSRRVNLYIWNFMPFSLFFCCWLFTLSADFKSIFGNCSYFNNDYDVCLISGSELKSVRMNHFDEVIDSLGAFGLYQRKVFVFVSIFEFMPAWAMLLPVFIGRTPDWWCQDNFPGKVIDIVSQWILKSVISLVCGISSQWYGKVNL